MNQFEKLLARAVLSCAISALCLAPLATAQSQNTTGAPPADAPNPADQGWHVDVAPYLWFPAINGSVGAGGHDAGFHVSAADVLSNFEFGLAGAVEARYNRIIIPVDFMWVKLSTDKGTSTEPGVESVHIKLNEDLFTPKIGYRIVSVSKFKADGLIGLRYWHFGTTLNLQPTEIYGGHYTGLNWVDGVAGARFQLLLSPKFVLSVAGDAGGGGARLDYQVVGLIGYKLKKVTLETGWRYLTIHKDPTGGSFVNVSMTGIVFGAVIPLK